MLNLDEVGELLSYSEKWEVNVGHNFDDLTPVTFNRDGYEVTFCERYDLAKGEANIGFKICLLFFKDYYLKVQLLMYCLFFPPKWMSQEKKISTKNNFEFFNAQKNVPETELVLTY